MIYPFLIPIVGILAAVAMVLGMPLVRAHARKMELQAQGSGVPPEVAARLERMEQAIEAIALEVERIAEGQRFTTRLLTEQAQGAGGQPSLPVGARAGDRTFAA